MDPLFVLGAAETIITHATRIKGFITACTTNQKMCNALGERVERLKELAEELKRRPQVLVLKQVENVVGVMATAMQAVKKYSNMKRALAVIFAVHIKGEFAEINDALDSVLLGMIVIGEAVTQAENHVIIGTFSCWVRSKCCWTYVVFQAPVFGSLAFQLLHSPSDEMNRFHHWSFLMLLWFILRFEIESCPVLSLPQNHPSIC